MRRSLAAGILLWLAASALMFGQRPAPPPKAGIINSRHDFRPTSTATVRATATIGRGDEQLCIYCHTPHNSNPGVYLWNQNQGTTNFPTYSSSTLQATITPPSPKDSSKLCLSCHDGTIALGNTVRNGQVAFVQGPAYQLPSTSTSNIAGFAGIGFSDDHPFAFTPTTVASEIKNPNVTDPVTLEGGEVQCSSCHDPHNETVDATAMKFLVKSNQGSAICLSCHQKGGWLTGASHKSPVNTANDLRYTALQGAHTGYTGVANNGCESCHRPHSPQVGSELLKFPEEQVCYQCHNGAVATYNIASEFSGGKTYRHPVGTTPAIHDPGESPNSALHPLPETSPSAPRHAQCMDCHNGHASNPSAASPPYVSGALAMVKGQSVSNGFVPQSTNAYEICFKCHGDSANKPQTNDIGLGGTGFGRNPKRQADFLGATPNPTRANTRMEFTTRPSYHPVVQPRNLSVGLIGEVPSLRPFVVDGNLASTTRALNAASYVYCSDCHGSDTGRSLGGGNAGPNGPHASSIPHLLERAYPFNNPPVSPGGAIPGATAGYVPGQYALCDKCHDVQNSIMRDRSFPHSEHLDEGVVCATCHDGHSANLPMLINFDVAIVGPSRSAGVIQYTRTGTHHGTCTLLCHNEDHEGETY